MRIQHQDSGNIDGANRCSVLEAFLRQRPVPAQNKIGCAQHNERHKKNMRSVRDAIAGSEQLRAPR
jgi:hypothetical protein